MTEEDSPIGGIPKIYSLAEAAEALGVAERWLSVQLTNRKFSGLKRAGRWAMTEPQILEAIESMTVHKREPDPDEGAPAGITRRSWMMRQRAAARRSLQSAAPETPPTPASPTLEVERVYRASPEAIAAMPPLSKAQQGLLDRLRDEGEIQVHGGHFRRPVEALVIRGLAVYEPEKALNEVHRYYYFRCTVRLP